MLRTTDYLLGPRRITPELYERLKANTAGIEPHDIVFLDALLKWCEVAGVDDANAVSQVYWESDNLRSKRYQPPPKGDRNPIGLGIVAVGTIQPFKINSYDEAARLVVQAIYAMVKKAWHPDVPMPEQARDWMENVWLKKVRHVGYPKGVDQVKDQNIQYTINGDVNATWAMDPDYMNHVTRFNRDLIPGLPDQKKEPTPVPTPTTKLVFGRVPMPERLELHDIVTNGPNTAYALLGPRRKLGTCTHRMVGSLLGTHGYFQNEAKNSALTDFGIGGPWDGANDGMIYQWVPGSSEAAPHANGAANDLEGDGIAFVQALGVSAVNRDLRSIELSDGGQHLRPYGPIDTKLQWEAHVALVAYIFDQAEVPWDQFPFNPHVGIVTYLEHWEFSTKDCPFKPVRDRTSQTQDAVRAILKMYQTGVGTDPSVPVPPPTPIETKPYSAFLDPHFLRSHWGAIRRVYADGSAAKDDTGKTKYYRWNPKWVPCSAWINRAKKEGEFPKPGDWTTFESKAEGAPVSSITFSNGWVLLRFKDDKIGWRWADEQVA